MKYFVADPYADMGIKQLAGDKVTVLSDDCLEYFDSTANKNIQIKKNEWSTDFDKIVTVAFAQLETAIKKHEQTAVTLKNEQQKLIKASPRLQRLSMQMKLF